MSSPFGMYGGYKAESPESRALGQFAADKFSYRDQAKNMIELNNAVGFMSGMMRKMQMGIDKANANVIQQIQGYFRDLLVLFGGGGDTGLDFGDLKYVFQGIGALFGFADSNGNITIPINLFGAAWHFFSNYIGISDNFVELINQIIDAAIATILDIFGNVPILGQALQQWAVIISEIRDLLAPVAEAVQAFFDIFNLNIGQVNGITDFFGPLKPIFDVFTEALQGIILPDFTIMFHAFAQMAAPLVDSWIELITILTDFASDGMTIFAQLLGEVMNMFTAIGVPVIQPVLEAIAQWTQPFIGILNEVIGAFSGIIGGAAPFIETIKTFMSVLTGYASEGIQVLADLLGEIINMFATIGMPIITPVLAAISEWSQPFIQIINEVIAAFANVAGGAGPLVQLMEAVTAIFSSINTVAFKPVMEAIAQWSAPFVALIVQLIEAFTAIVNSVMGTGNFNQLLNMFTDIFKILNLFNTAGFGSGLLSPSSWINGLSGFANNVLNPSNWAQSLLGFGNANSGISMIGSGQIQNAPQNLLMNGIFNSFNAFVPMNGWTVDPVNTVGNAVGSALVSLTNGIQSLVGNAIKVVTGDVLNFSTQTQWNGVSGNGLLSAPPIGMSVNLYADSGTPGLPGAFISSTPLATAGGSPGASPVATSGPPSAPSSWVPLTAAFTVPSPNSPAPAYAALVYHVSHEINVGEVRFTDADLSKISTMPQDAVRNLPEDKQAIIDKTAGTVGATLADIEARLAGIAAVTGHLDWAYAPDMRTINDALVNNLNGWAGSEWGHPDAAAAILGQKSTTVAANTSINTLKTAIAGIKADIAALGAPARTDVFWSDEFVRTNASSIGTGWTVTASGAGTQLLGTDGQRVVPNSLTQLASRYFHARWNGAQTTSNTDYQTITQVLGTAATEASGGAKGYNDTLGRVNGTSDYVRFRVIAGRPPTWSLDYILAGVAYNIIGGQLEWYPSTKKLICGNRDVPTSPVLSVYVDQQLIWTGSDTNHHIGASYRGMGFGYGIQYVSGNEPAIGGFPDSWTGIDTQLG